MWDGEEKGEEEGETEEERKRVSAESVCTGFYRRKPSIGDTIGDSIGGSNTSLNGYPGLNPSVFPSVNSSKKIHVITPLQLSKKVSRPSVYIDGITDRMYLLVNTD
jgi:hypothetical protein